MAVPMSFVASNNKDTMCWYQVMKQPDTAKFKKGSNKIIQ